MTNRHLAMRKTDGRTREARLMRKTREELVAHVGGHPSAVQSAIIEQCAWLQLQLYGMNEKMAIEGVLGEGDGRRYLAWSNSLARLLKQLGVKSAAQRGPDLQSYLRAKAGAEPAGAPLR